MGVKAAHRKKRSYMPKVVCPVCGHPDHAYRHTGFEQCENCGAEFDTDTGAVYHKPTDYNKGKGETAPI